MYGYFVVALFGMLFVWFVFDALKREQMMWVKHHLTRDKELYERAGKHLPCVNDMAVKWKYAHLWTVKQWIRWADRQQGTNK